MVSFQQNGDGSKENKGQKGRAEFIIAGSNSAKPLDFLKETLYQMGLFIKPPVYRPGIGHIALRRNSVTSVAFVNIHPNFFAAIGFVPQNIATGSIDFFQQFDSMGTVMVICFSNKP